jgi:hypothetical protein
MDGIYLSTALSKLLTLRFTGMSNEALLHSKMNDQINCIQMLGAGNKLELNILQVRADFIRDEVLAAIFSKCACSE